jgi:PAS domain S-box-containing protein
MMPGQPGSFRHGGSSIRLLIVDEPDSDVQPILAELQRAGLAPYWQRVDTEASYGAALSSDLDVILADYRLPSFGALRALEIVRERGLDVPLIVVSGTISEDVVVECMRQGATDYLLKDRLARLGPAVAHALEQRQLRADKRLAEARLRESEERYRVISENIRDGVFLVDLEGRVVFGNAAGERITGYSALEFVGRPVFTLLSPDGAKEVGRRLGAVQSGEAVAPLFETQVVRKDGTRVWVEAQASSVVRDGVLVGRLAVVRDISERKQAEQTLRLLALAVRHAGDSIVVTTANLEPPGPTIVFVNPAFTRITGYTAEEAVGKTPRILQGPATDRALLRQVKATLAAGREAFVETINYRKDRTEIHVAWHAAPVRDEAGRVTHFVAIQRDLTQAKRAEAELARQRDALHQSEKLAAMGQLLAGVAHELNNPLSVVLGHVALLRRTASGALAERAAKIAGAAERCVRIVRNFLALARQQPSQRNRIDLNCIARDAVELMAYPLRVDGVTVDLRLADTAPVLWGDADRLHQVVINLIANAHQALRETSGPRRLTITTHADGTTVTLEVADTGPGIPLEIQSRIFEPFFTTKPPGQGTGLGLSMCRSIAESHGGTIHVHSVPRHGATFRVTLAVGTPPESGEPAAEGGDAPPARPLRVLVVDDEPEVAEVAAEMLRVAGHRADTVTTGAAALDLIAGHRYDLVCCDVRMPGMDGPALYRRVEQVSPELARRWIFLTGDALGRETADFLQSVPVPTLAKPFAPEDLRRLVAQTARHG